MEGGGAALVTAAGDMTLGHCTRMNEQQLSTCMYTHNYRFEFGQSMKCMWCSPKAARHCEANHTTPHTSQEVRVQTQSLKEACP